MNKAGLRIGKAFAGADAPALCCAFAGRNLSGMIFGWLESWKPGEGQKDSPNLNRLRWRESWRLWNLKVV